jgi:peptide/nickel transport system substrate-binding protein
MIARHWLVLSAIALAALGFGLPARAGTPADTVVVAEAIDGIVSLDPAEAYGLDGEVVSNCYDRMMRYEPENLDKLVGEAVESWTVSDNGKTFTFKVRPGQKFHSGNPLTAEDIAFSLQRVVTLNKAPGFILTQLGWDADNAKHLIRAVDDSTLSLTIVGDFAPSLVLNLLSSTVASIVDEKEVMRHEVNGDLGNAWLKTHDGGSGAYILRSWTANDSVVMEANPDYPLGAPQVRRVILKHTPEPATQRLLLEKGDVDFARDLTTDQMTGLAGNPDIEVNKYPSGDIWYLALSQKIEALRKPKVREAIRYLIDYQGMAESFLKGQYFVHQSFWPSGFFASLEDNPFSLDVPKAKKLLAEAGYPEGFSVALDISNGEPWIDIAQSIQQTMAQAGIKVEIVLHDHKEASTLHRARKHQMFLNNWDPDFMDPHANAATFAFNIDNSDKPKARTLAWRQSWLIPELSAETEAARQEKDIEKRKQLYLDIQRKVQTDSPILILFQANREIAQRNTVKGFVVGAAYGAIYYRLMTK